MEESIRRKPEYFHPKRCFDLTKGILEEIALEGLDGITLQALFERLSRRPGFNILLDRSSKPYLWDIAKRLKNISYFLLKEPREVLTIQDRRDFLDDKGSLYEPVNAIEDIYEYCPIDDRNNGIRGSCKSYYTRKPCTNLVRRLSYAKVIELYEQRLVIVASQNQRERAMLHKDMEFSFNELSVIQYCLLERVARARYAGEITRGKVSLAAMKIDPKALFYQRKILHKNDLLLKQNISVKYGPSRTTSQVTILHLPKFYTYYETILKRGLSQFIRSIMNSPNKQREPSELKAIFGKHNMKLYLSNEYAQIFEQVDIPFCTLNPEIYENEKRAEKRERMEKRTVKMVRLQDPRINHINFVHLLPKTGQEKEADDPIESGILPPRQPSNQTTVLYDIFRNLMDSKAHGHSVTELSEINNTTVLDCRAAIRFLQKYKVVVPVLVDKKKTKMNKYVFFKFLEANKSVQTISVYSSEVPKQANSIFIDLEPKEIPGVTAEWTIPQIDIDSFIPVVDLESETIENSSSTKETNTNQITKGKDGLIRHKDGVCGSGCRHQPFNIALKLSPEVRDVIDKFNEHWNPKSDEISDTVNPRDLRFFLGEGNDFSSVQDKQEKSLSYVNSTDWSVILEYANVRPEYGRLPSFSSTPRIVERVNFIVNLIYEHKVIIGFQQLFRKIRIHVAALQNEPTQEKTCIDRRTVYRMLTQLYNSQLIQIFKANVQKNEIRKVCALFLPICVSIDSKLVSSAVEIIVAAAQGRVRLTVEERQEKVKRNRDLKNSKRLQEKLLSSPRSRKLKSGTKKLTKIISKRMKVFKRIRMNMKLKVPAKTRKFYDDVDRAALARMKRVRVDWTQKEDRFVLCIFIASVLFIPRYNHQKVFIFNPHQIRDILHSKLEEGKTKTALAIRRRLHFLMRKTSFFNRYRYYLTEAMTDEVLRDKYLKKFHERPSHKIFFKIPTKSLMTVVDYLQKKFRKLNVEASLPIQTKKSTPAANTYKSVVYENPTDVAANATNKHIKYLFEQTPDCIIVDCLDSPFDENSILVWTARTAILSLLLTGDEAEHVHNFLGSIPDKVLSFSLNAMRLIGLASWSKPNCRFGPSLPLRRMLQTHLSKEKLNHIYALLEEFASGISKTYNASNLGTIGSFVLLSELNTRNLLKFNIHLPDPMVTIDQEWEDRFQSIIDGVSENPHNDTRNLIDFDSEDSTYKLRPRTPRKRHLSESKLGKSKKSKIAALENQDKDGSLAALENVVSHQKGLQEALRTGSTSAGSSRALRMSNKALRLIRSQINSSEKGNFILRDFFTLNLPDITVHTNEKIFDQIIRERTFLKVGLEEIRRNFIKVTFCGPKSVSEKDQVYKIPTPMFLGQWLKLYKFIEATKHVGVSIRFLLTKFTRDTLTLGLRYLSVNNLIHLVGITHRKFVSVEHVEKWTMPIPDFDDNSIIKRVLFRPWINCLGGVNWIFIDQALSAILGFVSTCPETSVDDLCEYFTPVLSHVETLILVDALVGMEFLNLYALENNIEVGPFTLPSLVSKNYTVDSFLDLEILYVELNSLSIAKYSKLQALLRSETNKSCNALPS